MIMKFINEIFNFHGTGGIGNCLDRFLNEYLGCAPAIILGILFCKVIITPVLQDLALI
jgi:hypothetical protein